VLVPFQDSIECRIRMHGVIRCSIVPPDVNALGYITKLKITGVQAEVYCGSALWQQFVNIVKSKFPNAQIVEPAKCNLQMVCFFGIFLGFKNKNHSAQQQQRRVRATTLAQAHLLRIGFGIIA
jgi:hypothetical protein